MFDLAFSVCAVMFLTLAVVFLPHSAMAKSSALTAAMPEGAAPTKIEELLEITAQSLVRAEVAEHYEVVRELGRGKYGHVMLVTHRQRGKELTAPHELLCLVSSSVTKAWGRGWAGGTLGPDTRHGREDPQGDQQDGDIPSQEPSQYISQGPGDARGQPRISGKIIVIRQVQGQAGKLIHKSGSREFTDTHKHACDKRWKQQSRHKAQSQSPRPELKCCSMAHGQRV